MHDIMRARACAYSWACNVCDCPLRIPFISLLITSVPRNPAWERRYKRWCQQWLHELAHLSLYCFSFLHHQPLLSTSWSSSQEEDLTEGLLTSPFDFRLTFSSENQDIVLDYLQRNMFVCIKWDDWMWGNQAIRTSSCGKCKTRVGNPYLETFFPFFQNLSGATTAIWYASF